MGGTVSKSDRREAEEREFAKVKRAAHKLPRSERILDKHVVKCGDSSIHFNGDGTATIRGASRKGEPRTRYVVASLSSPPTCFSVGSNTGDFGAAFADEFVWGPLAFLERPFRGAEQGTSGQLPIMLFGWMAGAAALPLFIWNRRYGLIALGLAGALGVIAFFKADSDSSRKR